MRNKLIQPRSLSLCAAAACNLSCEYCLAKKSEATSAGKELFSKTVQALQDGTYIENILKVLERIEWSPLKFDQIQIWGEEPTLVIPYISEKWNDWVKTFPNVETVFFSTNGISHIESIYDLALSIEKNATHPMSLNIQFSYDGEYGEKNSRGGSKKQIEESISLLSELFNSTNFQNVRIYIYFHGVISTKTLEYLNTIEKVTEYYNEIDDFIKNTQLQNYNKNVQWGHVTLQIQNSFNGSSEDGINLTNFSRISHNISKQNLNNNYLRSRTSPIALEFSGGCLIQNIDDIYYSGCRTLQEFLEKKLYKYNTSLRAKYCTPLTGDLKVMFDGNVLTCQTNMFDAYIDEEKVSNSIFDQSRLNAVKHGQLINFINATDEEIEKYVYLITCSREHDTLSFAMNNIANLIFLLAKVGQVSETYLYDYDKIIRHAYLMANADCCYYALLTLVGSNFMRNAGIIRFLCNGFLDMIEEEINIGVEERYRNEKNISRR